MGSYADAAITSLMGAVNVDEGKEARPTHEENRDLHPEPETQRIIMEETSRTASDDPHTVLNNHPQMQEMQEIRRGTASQDSRNTPSSQQDGELQNQSAPAFMATDPDPPELSDTSSRQQSQVNLPPQEQQQQSSQKPAVPTRKFNVLHRDPEQTIQRLKHALREVESENHHFRNERAYFQHIYSAAKEETASIRRDFQDHIEKARFSRQKLEEKCELIQKDNEQLREYITCMSKAQQPIRGEDYYIQLFEELRGAIQSWMAKNSKLNAKETLAEGVETEVSGFLDNCGAHGMVSAKRLGEEIRALWTNRSTRVPLLRHVVAVFLFETVFNRFAFGHDRAASEYMKWIEGDLFRQDLEFTKILTIRQALGRAALQSQINRPDTLNRQETYKRTLTHILSHLLPKSNPQDIEAAVSKWIDKSVALRNAMTEEQAIYRCFIPDCGSPFEEEVMEVHDEQPSGFVLMCTFPGLDRLIFKEGKKVSVTVVKASAELQEEKGAEETQSPED